MRSRVTAITLTLTATFAGILLRFVPPEHSRLYPTCPIHQLFGILCPGCGATRALAALLHGNLMQAWHANALLLLLLPLALGYAATLLNRLWHSSSALFPHIPPPAIYTLLLATAVFTLARNLPH